MKSYYHLIKEVLPGINEEDLQLPLREGSIDSIDLLCIRTILEKTVGELPDAIWNRFTTVQQAIDYCQKEKREMPLGQEMFCVELVKEQEINMPQMANGCLSEHWLFKELGDLHWSLLSKGLNTSSGALRDEAGMRLYATFVRIQMIQPSLWAFAENELLHFNASIERFGNGTYISKTKGLCSGKEIKATLMTTFSGREEDNNMRLLKSSPVVVQNTIPECGITPLFMSDYRRMRKGLLECLDVQGIHFQISSEVIYETVYDINPYYEINGVGLLYFAAYPIISDVCEARYFNQCAKVDPSWECRYTTAVRDIFYLSNCNRDDQVIYQLNSYKFLEEGRVRLCSSLFRRSDRKLMARLFTIKTKC